MKKISPLVPFLLLLVLFTSCASKSDFIYLNGATPASKTVSSEMKLQPNDVLMIAVTSLNAEVAIPYNLQMISIETNKESARGEQKQLSYIISKEGVIDFPVIGAITIGGLTRIEAQNKIKNLLKEHIADASVIIRLLNFKVTVLGEVNRPGTIQVANERMTILEAIGNAGDLSVFGKRKNILLIREHEGQTQTHRLDLTSADLLTSPYYYLVQNDVIYVEPNKTKINSSAVGPNLTVGISAISLLITILALTTR